MRRFDLTGYDGVLAFGQSLAEVYRRSGWGRRAFTFHEAADTHLFQPLAAPDADERAGIVWVGNWGDEERSGGRVLRLGISQMIEDVTGARIDILMPVLIAQAEDPFPGFLIRRHRLEQPGRARVLFILRDHRAQDRGG